MEERLSQLLRPVADVPERYADVAEQLLRRSLDYPPDRFMTVVVGKLRDRWTVVGPFLGRTLEDARAEAVAASAEFSQVHVVGPVRVAEVREMLFGA